METALQNIFHHLQTLRAFQAAHAVPDGLCRVHVIEPDEKVIPGVTFYGEDEESRSFALKAFGADGWVEEPSLQSVTKVVDGVRVVFWRAADLLSVSVREVEVAP